MNASAKSDRLLADKTELADPDLDGIPNVLEYILAGNPAAASTVILPSPSVTGADFSFNFSRLKSSNADTEQIFQYSNDMIHWAEIMIDASANPMVTLGAVDSSGKQPVTVTIPKGTNNKLFGRLKAYRP